MLLSSCRRFVAFCVSCVPTVSLMADVSLLYPQFKTRASVSSISGSISSSMGDVMASQKKLDIDAMKRNAPLLHSSQARNEVSLMVAEKVYSSVC